MAGDGGLDGGESRAWVREGERVGIEIAVLGISVWSRKVISERLAAPVMIYDCITQQRKAHEPGRVAESSIFCHLVSV